MSYCSWTCVVISIKSCLQIISITVYSLLHCVAQPVHHAKPSVYLLSICNCQYALLLLLFMAAAMHYIYCLSVHPSHGSRINKYRSSSMRGKLSATSESIADGIVFQENPHHILYKQCFFFR